MPLLVAAIIGGLVQAVGTLVGRVLVSLGYSYVVYYGVAESLDWVKDQVLARISASGTLLVQIAGLLQVGTCLSILTSALAARLLLDGLGPDGAIRKLVQS